MIILIGVVGVFIAYFYNADPLKIGYTRLSELSTGFGFGPLMVLGAYYVQARRLSWEAFFVSIPIAILIALVRKIGGEVGGVIEGDRGPSMVWEVWSESRMVCTEARDLGRVAGIALGIADPSDVEFLAFMFRVTDHAFGALCRRSRVDLAIVGKHRIAAESVAGQALCGQVLLLEGGAEPAPRRFAMRFVTGAAASLCGEIGVRSRKRPGRQDCLAAAGSKAQQRSDHCKRDRKSR